MYWKARIALELAVIATLVWYIEMELVRTKQIDNKWVLKGLHKRNPKFKTVLQSQAMLVYSDMYRNESASRFTLVDTNSGLDGCSGRITHYDLVSQNYRSLVQPKDPKKSGIYMVTRTPNMEAMNKISLDEYNKSPRREESTIKLSNPENGNDFTVSVRHDVLRHVCTKHRELDSKAVSSAEIMLQSIEKIEHDKQAAIVTKQAEYHRVLKRFQATHKKRPTDRPGVKRAKLHRNLPNHQVQIHQKEKMSYITNKFRAECTSMDTGQHLFTFPFKTIDNSLIESSATLNQMNKQYECKRATHNDALFSSTCSDSIIVNMDSIESLKPGVDINEDILNFCMVW